MRIWTRYGVYVILSLLMLVYGFVVFLPELMPRTAIWLVMILLVVAVYAWNGHVRGEKKMRVKADVEASDLA